MLNVEQRVTIIFLTFSLCGILGYVINIITSKSKEIEQLKFSLNSENVGREMDKNAKCGLPITIKTKRILTVNCKDLDEIEVPSDTFSIGDGQ